MKIVINTTYGGFIFSNRAQQILKEREFDYLINCRDVKDYKNRAHPAVVKLFEELDDEEIKIIEIPDDVKDWYIAEYDGREYVGEGRRWCYEDLSDSL